MDALSPHEVQPRDFTRNLKCDVSDEGRSLKDYLDFSFSLLVSQRLCKRTIWFGPARCRTSSLKQTQRPHLMAHQDCPLPEVGEVLAPYIKSREEAAAIRQTLQSHVQSQLRSNDVPLSSVNLTTAPSFRLESPPARISGVRKTYWKALQAHNEAQAKYDALRSDLEKLKHQRPSLGGKENQTLTAVNEDYIPLLRQREKQRKLKAIETAHASIASAAGDLATAALDDIVKKQIGEPPIPPSSPLSSDRSSDAESKILELKRALISTKRRVEERQMNVASPKINGAGGFSPQMEIAGLQNMLQELTAWMETQLTIIASSEASEPPNGSPARISASDDISNSTTGIEPLYQKYVEARERLVKTVNNPSKASFDHVDNLISDAPNPRDPEPSSKSSAEILLPYIPILLAAKQEEQALMQQSAYVRRHVAASESATDRLLRRLADESHLVQPGASSGGDWAEAAREASDATKSFVKARVQAGEASVNSADEALDGIKFMPASLDRLLPSS